MLGYRAFKNIWIVSAILVTSILVVEPTLAWFLFKEIPTLGASIGIGLGVIGLIVALVF
jgi:drug/metabolite transporter (DMT)-like permease